MQIVTQGLYKHALETYSDSARRWLSAFITRKTTRPVSLHQNPRGGRNVRVCADPPVISGSVEKRIGHSKIGICRRKTRKNE